MISSLRIFWVKNWRKSIRLKKKIFWLLQVHLFCWNWLPNMSRLTKDISSFRTRLSRFLNRLLSFLECQNLWFLWTTKRKATLKRWKVLSKKIRNLSISAIRIIQQEIYFQDRKLRILSSLFQTTLLFWWTKLISNLRLRNLSAIWLMSIKTWLWREHFPNFMDLQVQD